MLGRLRTAELQVTKGDALGIVAARSYFRLLCYKDEYEVARLLTLKPFLESLKKNFGPDARPRFHFAPPILNSEVDARGRPRKREFGPWILPVLRVLAALRRLRGTPFDLFGRTAERQMERELITGFEGNVDEIIANLRTDNVAIATRLLGHYLDIRGFGPVKEQSVVEVREAIAKDLHELLTEQRDAA